ncbi:hypothetical protein [Schaedlerella arabinosiphila]|uniref:hypothetical protein n=1 Tax=Schaedlerella arabinosiphila TaxID=2044587 RepID=UPI0012B68F16|nr:hypothetical protein [Schaedlerella arabinosiphila]
MVLHYVTRAELFLVSDSKPTIGVEAMMPWSEFIKERCTRVMDTETETPENRGQIPL